MAANSNGTRVYPWPVQNIINELRSPRLAGMLRFYWQSNGPQPLQFNFKHSASFTSWGEHISVTLYPINENETSVNIRSECSMPTQIIDWGQNSDNINLLFRHLEIHVPQTLQNPYPNNQAPMQNAMAQCPTCGRPLTPDSRFCPGCGTKLQ